MTYRKQHIHDRRTYIDRPIDPTPDDLQYKAFEPQLDALWQCITEITGCDRSIVYIRSRAAVHVEPRQIFFHLAYTSLGKIPLRVIGQYAGGRDHSTVIHGSDNIAGLIQYDKRLADLLERIKNHLVGRVPAHEDPEVKAKLFSPYLGFIAGG